MKEQMNKTTDTSKRVWSGVVVSDKMDKTIVVEVERTYRHASLNKVMKSVKNYKVHDENKVAKLGDHVEFFQGRPVSKTKFMYLSRVLNTGATR